jgi:competence CoiA-like predicted nuclease
MKFAIVETEKREALHSGERGICICCGSETIAHCGDFMVHHWKHKKLVECDDWYEGETEWHRDWKNKFPTQFQEIVKYDLNTNEKHIADIFHPTRQLTIEFQHSPISLQEITSRESFYEKMIWVIDVIPFKTNITFHKNIQDAFFECIIMPWARDHDRIVNELRKQGKEDEADKFIDECQGDEYIEKFEVRYKKHSKKEDYFLMQWKYQHKRWNRTNCPLFFDIGDEYLYMSVESIEIWNGFIVKRFPKFEFVSRFINE